MVRSKHYRISEAGYFWTRPWKTMPSVVWITPYLCMRCGKVDLYVDPGDLAGVQKEYDKVKYG
jgi:hypothetical protein